MQKCRHADEYQGKVPPKCNAGRGCEVCKAKYASVRRAEMRIRERMRQAGT